MKIGDVLRKWRKLEDLSLRDASAEIGVSTPTLSRVERGEEMSGPVLAKILTWLLR